MYPFQEPEETLRIAAVKCGFKEVEEKQFDMPSFHTRKITEEEREELYNQKKIYLWDYDGKITLEEYKRRYD